MNARQIHEARGQKTFALVFDTGDEVMEGLTSFPRYWSKRMVRPRRT